MDAYFESLVNIFEKSLFSVKILLWIIFWFSDKVEKIQRWDQRKPEKTWETKGKGESRFFSIFFYLIFNDITTKLWFNRHNRNEVKNW